MNSNFYDLVSFLGSPFAEDNRYRLDLSKREKSELYELARINKVRLFFLEKLKNLGKLSALEDTFEADMDRYLETLRTAAGISARLKEVTEYFAIFKFSKPYSHTPSDVDVLLFLPNYEISSIVSNLLENGYHKIGESPSQFVLYDLRGGFASMDTRTVEGKQGGKYYIDLYREISASYFIYISKNTVENYRTTIDSPYGPIQTLSPTADLPIVLTHSIVPEQLFTLADFYTSLSFIKHMGQEDIDDMLKLIEENNITKAIATSLSLTRSIHENVFGFVPDEVDNILNRLPSQGDFFEKQISNEFSLPYRYEPSIIIGVLMERMKNKKGLMSMLNQGLHMADPRLMRWVIYNIILRRTRDTY